MTVSHPWKPIFRPPRHGGYNVGMSELPKWARPNSIARWVLAVPIIAAGLAVFANGVFLETRNPRSNDEDDFAWRILAIGISIIGAGVSIPFVRPWIVPLVAIASPFVAFAAAVILFWSAIILNALIRTVLRL
jgi:hypothetical protein